MSFIGEKFGNSHTTVRKIVIAYEKENRVCAKKSQEKRVVRRILEISEVNSLLSVPKIRSQMLNEGRDRPSTYITRRRLRD